MMHHNAGSHLRPQRLTQRADSTSDSSSDSFIVNTPQTTASYSAEDTPPPSDSESEDESEDAAQSQSESESDSQTPILEITLSRRKNGFGVLSPPAPVVRQGSRDARDVAAVQKLWRSHALSASKIFPKSMWGILNAIKYCPKTTQSAVLEASKILLPRCDRKYWPSTRTLIDKTLSKKLGTFHPRVTRSINIDLSANNLPSLAKPFTFSFIDPVFAWAECAYRLSKSHELYFEHRALVHPVSGERLYGASVQNGDLMEEACRTRLGAPAMIGISWDAGQASRRRSYTPILISVGNTDYKGKHACVCIGYMPDLNLGAHVKTDAAKTAMHELRQTVIGAITHVIEGSARHGFKCLLSSESGCVSLTLPKMCVSLTLTLPNPET